MNGDAMKAWIARLQPICRSITGEGVRETLRLIGEQIPLERHEIPSGTPVLDWTVPPEWNIRDAWIKDASGRRVVDFARSNLHVVSYSVPVAPRWISREELEPHLHSLPERPDWIPYRTAYYEPSWGFCLSQRAREALTDDRYEIAIDATLAPGALSYGELRIEGESEREILISAHVCHPSLCNDNLSGIAVAVELARDRLRSRPKLSYRFLFAPGTIGAISWLARHREAMPPIAHGLTLVCLGDAHPLQYKQTFAGDAPIDRAMALVLGREPGASPALPFHPYGYDERQYNSPGFRLPVGSLMRGRHGEFPEYHTSADDLDFIRPESLEQSADRLREVCDLLEQNARFRSLVPYGEPQLGRRGLYQAIGGGSDPQSLSRALLWVLQFSDGKHDLIEVAARSGMPWRVLDEAAGMLEANVLIERLAGEGEPCGS
jgi:aminopeptidase-like protein